MECIPVSAIPRAVIEERLRQLTILVLRSAVSNGIKVSHAGRTMMPYVFSYLADCVERHVLEVSIRTLPAVYAAQYDDRSDTLIFNSLSSVPADTPERRRTIIHECVHAALDLTAKGSRIEFADSEFLAFLVESIYAVAMGYPAPPPANPFATGMYQLAQKVRATSGIYTCVETDSLTLKDYIRRGYSRHQTAAGFIVPDGFRRSFFGDYSPLNP
jgi:hypothetical protein